MQNAYKTLMRKSEDKRAFRYNTQQCKFAQHLREYGHAFGNIENIMEVLQFHKKGIHLNTIEKFYIHKESTNNNYLNEEYTDTTNQIFNTILEHLQ